jgi:hypothetical protein
MRIDVEQRISTRRNALSHAPNTQLVTCKQVHQRAFTQSSAGALAETSQEMVVMAPAAPPGKPRCLVFESVECLKVFDIISGPDRWQGSGVSPNFFWAFYIAWKLFTRIVMEKLCLSQA